MTDPPNVFLLETGSRLGHMQVQGIFVSLEAAQKFAVATTRVSTAVEPNWIFTPESDEEEMNRWETETFLAHESFGPNRQQFARITEQEVMW